MSSEIDDTFEQRPFLLVFKKRKVERKFLNYHYGNDRNWTIFIIYCIGSLAISQFAFTADRDYIEWWTTDLLTALFVGCYGFLFCFKCTIRCKFLIEFSVVITYLVISIRYNIKALIVEGLALYPMKMGTVIFDICFFFVLRPRFFVYIPLSIIICLTFTIFVSIYFTPRVNDFRVTSAIVSYILNQFVVLVFLFFNDQTCRSNFIQSEILALKKKKYEEEHAKSVQLLKNIIPETFLESIFDGTLSRDGVLIDDIEGSVLCTDVVNFSGLSSQLSGEEIVFFLDRHFSVNDEIIKSLSGIEKVKTIGDSELVVSLANTEHHELKMVMLGLAIIESLELLNKKHGWKENDKYHTIKMKRKKDHSGVREEKQTAKGVTIRVGVSSGRYFPMVFGSGRKVSFDVFGKPIKECYRLEPTGIPGFVHVSQKVFKETCTKFNYFQDDRKENVIATTSTEEEASEEEYRERQIYERYYQEEEGGGGEEIIIKDGGSEEDDLQQITFFVPHQKRLKSILDKKLRREMRQVVRYALSSKSYIKKRQNLIARCEVSHGKGKRYKKFEDDITEAGSEEDFYESDESETGSEDGVGEETIDETKLFATPSEYNLFTCPSSASISNNYAREVEDDEAILEGLTQPFISDEDRNRAKQIDTDDIFTEYGGDLYSSNNDLEVAVKIKQRFMDRCFACCFSSLKMLVVSYLCSPCISMTKSFLNFFLGCVRCCVYPASKFGWVYPLSIFLPLGREREFIEKNLIQSEKLTFLLIFLLTFSHRFVIVVYLVATKRFPVLYKSVLIYSFYVAFTLEIFSVLYLLLTMLPIYVTVTKKKTFKVDNPVYSHSAIDDKSGKVKKKVKVIQWFKQRAKLFHHILYRPMAIYLLTFLNFIQLPLELIFLILFDGGHSIPIEVLTSGEDNSTPIFLDIFFLMFLYGLVYIALVPFFHICFRIFLFFFFVCLQIFHVFYNYKDMPEPVHGHLSRVGFLIREAQFTLLIIVFFVFYSVVNDIGKRNAFNKKKRIISDSAKIVEKKAKNDMIIRSVLPREVIIMEKKRKRNSKKGRFGNVVIGVSKIPNVCFCFVTITNIEEAFLLPFDSNNRQLSNSESIESTHSGDIFSDEEGRDSKKVKTVVNFVVDLFKEFDEILEICGCRRIKAFQDALLFITIPSSHDDSHSSLKKKRVDGYVNNGYIKKVVTASELCLKKLMSLQKKYCFTEEKNRISLRIGLHVGSCMSGVVGNSKFLWDIYGDAVNLSSHLSSTGEDNKVHLLRETTKKYSECFESVRIRHGGRIELKGKESGVIKTSFLELLNHKYYHRRRPKRITKLFHPSSASSEEDRFLDPHQFYARSGRSSNSSSSDGSSPSKMEDVSYMQLSSKVYERRRKLALENQAIEKVIQLTHSIHSSMVEGMDGDDDDDDDDERRLKKMEKCYSDDFHRKGRKRRRGEELKFFKMQFGRKKIYF